MMFSLTCYNSRLTKTAITKFKSSGSHMYFKIRIFTNFANSKKSACVSLFYATLLKKGTWHRCFPVNFANFLRTRFFYRTPPVTASPNLINRKTQRHQFSLD